MAHSEWLYYQIYPGHFERLDRVIRDIVAPAVEAARQAEGLQRWFFLRYIDHARGVHIRLRFQGQPHVLDALEPRISALIAEKLADIREAEPEPTRRLVPLPAPPPLSGYVGYELGIYEPEYEKYGGEDGVRFAEQVFQTSSEIALEVLRGEDAPMGQRAVTALLLMQAAAEVAVEAERRDAFWEEYTAYWCGEGQLAAAGQIQAHLRSAAARRRDVAASQRAHHLGKDHVRRQVEAFRAAIRDNLAAARDQGLPVTAEHLGFHHIHLMNNRLGITPLEEAYLAQLLVGAGER